MFKRQKPIGRQVVVITGGTSGVGLETAHLAGRSDARVVIAARSAEGLRKAAAELLHVGIDVATVEADVGSKDNVERIAAVAIERFGHIDTWVNNAGQTIFGRLVEVSERDLRALMEVNFWGTVHGSLVAATHLRQRGGTIVNIGSIGSDFAFPLQGMYSASKHAIRGFTDALRMELEHDKAPISVTLVKPSSIDTPLPQRARNYMEAEPDLPPPVYRPCEVARAIVSAATSPHRDIYVGGGGRLISALATSAPRLFDLAAPPLIMALQKRKEAPRDPNGALHTATAQEGRRRGSHRGFVNPISLYDRMRDLPLSAIALAASAAVLATTRARR